jgi:DNA-directed RNA polymerase subunit beta'
VDVAQDAIIREPDCGTEEGIILPTRDEDGEINRSLLGRCVNEDVKEPKGKKKLLEKGGEISEAILRKISDSGVDNIEIRSVLVCESRFGICQKCYGQNLATGMLADIGDAVGIIAAQSIGEPGTQLTMRTFHTGGVAGEDITHGLPRVVELFEARKPKGQAILVEEDGILSVEEAEKNKTIKITTKDGKEIDHQIPRRARLLIELDENNEAKVKAGDQITHGSLNPYDILRIKGIRAAQTYLVREVQEVYRSQGVEINDKHVELIVRQMLKKVAISEAGDTDLLPGQIVDTYTFENENEKVKENGGEPATAKHNLLGITKASLATDSFLSAASFQETTRVLTDAAISGKSDPLLGLKENVIIGKLIPAATGMKRYRQIKLVFPGEQEDMYPEAIEEALAEYPKEEIFVEPEKPLGEEAKEEKGGPIEEEATGEAEAS